MPRAALTAEQRRRTAWEAEDEEIRERIGAWMMRTGKSIVQLGILLGMSQATIYSRVRRPGTFKLNEYRRLLEVVGE